MKLFGFLKRKLALFIIKIINEVEGDQNDRLINGDQNDDRNRSIKTKEPIPTGKFNDDGYW